MARYYTTNEAIPAAAITYAGSNTPVQPVLFTTQSGYRDIKDERYLCWTIRSIKVTVVRDWATSTAQIVLTTNIPNAEDRIPNLPDLSFIRGGNHPYLTYEDEIRIYAGWIDSPSTPICADMLDQYAIDLCPEGLAGRVDGAGVPLCAPADEYPFRIDKSKPLVPIFWGFIDTISVVADKGISCVIQCRDRTRIFSDTKIISIPSLQGSLVDSKSGGLASGNRDQIALQVARAAVGEIITGSDPKLNKQCWKTILGPDKGAKVFTGYTGDPNISLERNEPPEDPAGWVRAATHKIMDSTSAPRFHIWLQRPPYKKGNGAAVFQILDRTPIEVISFLANTEERPTDFYASQVNGDFVLAPRVLDTSGFYDPNRMYRTYFYKTYPKDRSSEPPLANQMIINMRVASSSFSTFNRYVVVDSETSGAYGDFMENIQMALEIENWSLANRTVTPPCRNMIIYDGNLGSYEGGSKAGAALLVGLTAGRTYSRELAAINMTVIGDPTLYPGEAVRVYNSVLHDFATSINPGTPESTAAIEQQQRDWEDLTSKESKARFDAQPAGSLNNFNTNAVGKEEVAKLETGRAQSGSYILPVYKVRSIQHNISSQGDDIGFTTRLEMVVDY